MFFWEIRPQSNACAGQKKTRFFVMRCLNLMCSFKHRKKTCYLHVTTTISFTFTCNAGKEIKKTLNTFQEKLTRAMKKKTRLIYLKKILIRATKRKQAKKHNWNNVFVSSEMNLFFRNVFLSPEIRCFFGKFDHNLMRALGRKKHVFL